MNQSVVIKANTYGIRVILDPKPDFPTLKQQVADKFRESAKFLGNADLALGFEGRELSEAEEKELLSVISDNCELRVICVIDHDQEKEELYRKTLSEKLMDLEARTGQFYKGNLRSGQVLEFDTSVIVLGDVNPGAKVISKGNIIIIGALKGMAAAGAAGNENAFILALSMKPMQLRIGDILARCSDNEAVFFKSPSAKFSALKPKLNRLLGKEEEEEKEEKAQTQIAFVENGNIYVEPLDRNNLENLQF